MGVGADLAGIRPQGTSVMISQQRGLLARQGRAERASLEDRALERERLRRELLRRILDREMRRQAIRGARS
jgi:hypothetical protein